MIIKLGVGITRQDTIEEIVEVDDREHRQRQMSLRKVDSYDGGLRTTDPLALLYASRQIPADVTEYKEIMNNIMDFKIDVKLEIQRLNQRMERMEELLSDLCVKITNSTLGGGGSMSQSPQGESDQEKSVRLRSSSYTIDKTASGGVASTTSTGGQGGGDCGTGLGPIILKKRRAKSRTKGIYLYCL